VQWADKARELVAKSGIGFGYAVLVAQGRMTLDQALKAMLTRERQQRLIDQGMAGSVAGQVAKGHLSEAKGWEAMRVQAHPAFDPTRSGIDAGRVGLACLRSGPRVAELLSVGRYAVSVAETEGPPLEVPKHELAWVAPADSLEAVARCFVRCESVESLGWSASDKIEDRLRVPRAVKLDLLDASQAVRMVLRDGTEVRALPSWCSQYEFGVRVLDPASGEPAGEASIFQHALVALEFGEGRTVALPQVSRLFASTAAGPSRDPARPGPGAAKPSKGGAPASGAGKPASSPRPPQKKKGPKPRR
jgi:hypothetical protein